MKKLLFISFFIFNLCFTCEKKDGDKSTYSEVSDRRIPVTYITEISTNFLQDGKIQKTIFIKQKDNENICLKYIIKYLPSSLFKDGIGGLVTNFAFSAVITKDQLICLFAQLFHCYENILLSFLSDFELLNLPKETSQELLKKFKNLLGKGEMTLSGGSIKFVPIEDASEPEVVRFHYV